MNKVRKRLEKLTGEALNCSDPSSDEGLILSAQLTLLQELNKVWDLLENSVVEDDRIKKRLSVLTEMIMNIQTSTATLENVESFKGEVKIILQLIKTWNSVDSIDVATDEVERDRKSLKTWDGEDNVLTTKIKLTKKQEEAILLLDSGLYDKFLALGGSGSGKSFILAYVIVRDCLRHKAPCLIARNVFEDLKQGMIDQIIPTVLNLIAKANGQERWDTWLIDGLKFAKWSDKKTKLEFATGGYIRFAGLSARDLSESGSDKILSPSWLHVMLEEISELDYEIVEKLITRLRVHVEGILNKLMMCENPPSINHWSYKRFYEFKREDGSSISDEERSQMYSMLMNPVDNVENLGETYIRNLSQMSGANRERFYLGKFQDTETGEIFKSMHWTDNLPRPFDYEKIVVYTDPTPLTGKEHSIWADYKASVLLGLFEGETYVLDVRAIRGSTTDMLNSMMQLWEASPNKAITEVVMENKQVPSDFKQVLTQFSILTGWSVPVQSDNRKFGEKKSSIETFLQPLFEHGMIHFNEKFRDTERGIQTQHQILKFSRKSNKMVHDDIPDAIRKGDTWMRGRKGKKKRVEGAPLVSFVHPAYIQSNTR